MHVLEGEVFDVAVDIRRGSPNFGRWVGVTLSAENKHQLYIPRGFAHGFLVTSETAIFQYKCDNYYAQAEERGLRWDDPDVDIAWPGGLAPILAERDATFPLLRDLDADLPPFEAP